MIPPAAAPSSVTDLPLMIVSADTVEVFCKASATNTSQTAVFPSDKVAEILVKPAPTPLTVPSAATVAAFVLLLVHFIVLFVVLEVSMEAVSFTVLPADVST